jgi:dipeptidyl aminopeptidase/acylaminoacyl peptidase
MKKRFTGIVYSILLLISLLPANIVLGQGTSTDYERAAMLSRKFKDKILYAPERIEWIAGSGKIAYWQQTPKGKELMLVDVKSGEKKSLINQIKLSEQLSAATTATIKPYSLDITSVKIISDHEIRFIFKERNWQYDELTGKLSDGGKVILPRRNTGYWGDSWNDQKGEPVKSPDGKWSAYIRDYNVFLRPATDSLQPGVALSFDGSEGEYYSSHLEWSPDSKKIVGMKTRPNKQHLIYLIESSPADQLQPKLHSRNYLKPGDALPQRQPVLFTIDDKKSISIDRHLIDAQYQVSWPEWTNDSRAFRFEYNQRGHQVYKVIEVDAASGEVKNLIDERSKTFIDYSGKKYRHDTKDGKEIIWASERDGWNHLYLYDAGTAKVKNQITKGDWVVRNVIKVNEVERTIIFEAGGTVKDQDPYFIQYYRINFDGTGLVALTSENGNHTATFSPDYSLFVDVWSRLDKAPVTTIKSAVDGKIIRELAKADIEGLLATGWKLPEIFHAKGRDGATDIWGMIIRPSNFDPAKKYPVIEYIYAGPHSSFVPKSFAADSRGDLHQLVELGFIVVQIDGMGTSNRSKAFHDVCWKNLKDGGFPDRILWMKEAAKKYPYMDLTRVGIFGNSAGGQSSAGALLFHPDFYKVAVSSSGCHDNRMDKMWWNELWMGYPIGPQYAESSNVTNAHRLKGKLLLILGELDDNVDPSSSLQLMDALIKANKTYDFLLVPGMGHSMGGDYGEHKRRDFFVKHLIGVDPPEWNGQQSVVFPGTSGKATTR